MNEHESAAMWRIYLGSEEGIAIRSTYLSLRESLRDAPQPVQIGTVTYLNYLKEWMPEDNIFYPFLHKRLSFEHEHELRAIYQELPTALTPADRVPETESGVNIPVDLDVLIGQVYVAPTSADWYFELVKSITNRYLPGKQVLRSGLDDDPVY